MAQSVTLSSVGTAAMALNPVSKSTTFLLTAASSGAVYLEMSLDDPSIVGGPTTTWSLLSSAVSMVSSNLSAGLIYTVLSPVAQVRINSTALVAGGSYTLKALQSVTA